MRRFATLAIVVALCAPLSACGSSSPKAALASIVAAALSEKSVHVTAVDSVDHFGAFTTVVDVSRHSGTGRVTGPIGGSEAEIRLVDNTVYLKGTSSALERSLPGLVAAPHYAGKWISMPMQAQSVKWTAANLGGGDNVYSQMSDGLTLASILNGVPPQLELKMVNGLPGRVLGSFKNQGDRYSVDARFSKWNEPVHVQAPAHAIPIATVRG